MSTRPPADQPHLAEEALEAQLLTHFRQHSQGEPSAELDARMQPVLALVDAATHTPT